LLVAVGVVVLFVVRGGSSRPPPSNPPVALQPQPHPVGFAPLPDEPPPLAGRVEPPAPPPPRDAAPQGLVGVWERPSDTDGYPFRVTVRADGSAELVFDLKDGRRLAHPASLVLPSGTAGEWFVARFDVAMGSYGYTVRLDGADRLTIRTEDGGGITFRRVK
jgi:hypothetical protein